MDETYPNTQGETPSQPPQFLKVQKRGMGQLALSHRIKEGDIIVAIDGDLILGDSETLKAAFSDYDPDVPNDIAWLVTFWREGVFFNVCLSKPLKARYEFATPEEALAIADGFKSLTFEDIQSYRNFEVFRDLHKNAGLHTTRPDPLATIAPLLWLLNHRLYYPMLAITIIYAVTAVTHIALFLLAYVLVSLYTKRAQLNLLRSYQLFEDKFFWLVIGATDEIEAREACRRIDPEVKFAFDKEEKQAPLNRLERKKLQAKSP
jgi:hypothetical protein